MDAAPALKTWSTRRLRPGQRFDGWREMVNRTHLHWDLPRPATGGFEASVSEQAFGAARIIRCVCDPCDGRRSAAEIGRSDPDYIGVLHVLKGREAISQGGSATIVEAGEFCVWDGRRPLSFSVRDDARLSKITLMAPRALFHDALPHLDARVARSMSGAEGPGVLFFSHMRTLARELGRVPEAYAASLLTITLDLLRTALTNAPSADRRAPPDGDRLEQAQAFVALNLGDPNLSPTMIATALGISLRQLHRVFADAGLSVERWTWSERLAACAQRLRAEPEESVSAVAFRYGFNDAAHFSRAFRARYGHSPRAYRRLPAASLS